jgi:hypothetical protein
MRDPRSLGLEAHRDGSGWELVTLEPGATQRELCDYHEAANDDTISDILGGKC